MSNQDVWKLAEGRKVQSSVNVHATSQQWNYLIHYPSIFLEEFSHVCFLHILFPVETTRHIEEQPPPHTARWADALLPVLQTNLRLHVFCSQGCSAQTWRGPPFPLLSRGSENGWAPHGPVSLLQRASALVLCSPGPPSSESSHVSVQQ